MSPLRILQFPAAAIQKNPNGRRRPSADDAAAENPPSSSATAIVKEEERRGQSSHPAPPRGPTTAAAAAASHYYQTKNAVLFTASSSNTKTTSLATKQQQQQQTTAWTKVPLSDESSTSVPTTNGDRSTAATTKLDQIFKAGRHWLYDTVVRHFVPANYPASVAPGYTGYTVACACAAVFGSASMVLSTQTLFLAVGSAGSAAAGSAGAALSASDAATAGMLAGALNWVLKDGVGQAGGVLFASFVSGRGGRGTGFDADPKRWRMAAALALDAAAALELSSPFLPSAAAVLPLACAACVLKNVGFLTSSASRAALHQALAIRGNLADVTVKAGSQSMLAGLLGTALGIGLSHFVLHQELGPGFVATFAVLTLLHQGCNYVALQNVALPSLNRQRLYLVLEHYIQHNRTVPTPMQVANQEQFFPFLAHTRREGQDWLNIGAGVETILPHGPEELRQLREACANEQHILKVASDFICLTYLESSTGEDLIRGMTHAMLLKHRIGSESRQQQQDKLLAIQQSHLDMVQSDIVAACQAAGWLTAADTTNIESSAAVRLSLLYEHRKTE
jgi:Vitamin B6 photo-protection and homoeostasis